MAKKKKKKADSVVADFGHKEAKGGGGGRRPHFPEGDYLVKITNAEKKESKESGNTYIRWYLEIQGPKKKGKTTHTNTMLSPPKALWNLRNLLEALGKEVPDKKVKVPYTQCIGELVGVTFSDDEYNNKKYSEVTDWLDPDLVEEDDDDDDEDEDDEDLDDEDSDDDDDDDEDDDDEMEDVDLDEL